MPNYKYLVRSPDGKTKSGTLSADTASSAAAVLRNQGVHVMSVDQVKEGFGETGFMKTLNDLNTKNQRRRMSWTLQLSSR